jgi:hypothetical protein
VFVIVSAAENVEGGKDSYGNPSCRILKQCRPGRRELPWKKLLRRGKIYYGSSPSQAPRNPCTPALSRIMRVWHASCVVHNTVRSFPRKERETKIVIVDSEEEFGVFSLMIHEAERRQWTGFALGGSRVVTKLF